MSYTPSLISGSSETVASPPAELPYLWELVNADMFMCNFSCWWITTCFNWKSSNRPKLLKYGLASSSLPALSHTAHYPELCDTALRRQQRKGIWKGMHHDGSEGRWKLKSRKFCKPFKMRSGVFFIRAGRKSAEQWAGGMMGQAQEEVFYSGVWLDQMRESIKQSGSRIDSLSESAWLHKG